MRETEKYGLDGVGPCSDTYILDIYITDNRVKQ